MAKPAAGSAPLRWATSPLIPADVTEPDTTHKDQGWQDAEEPPHSYFNYWKNLVYLWIVYLHNLEAEALTWTAAHIFQAAVTFNGAVTHIGNVTVRGDMFWKSADGIDTYGAYDNSGSNPIFTFASANIDTLTVDDEFVSVAGVNEFHGDVWIDESVLTVGAAAGVGAIILQNGSADFGGADLTDINELHAAGPMEIGGTALVVNSGNVSMSGNVTVTGLLTTGDLSITDDLTVGDALTVNGDADFNSHAQFDDNVDMSQNLVVAGTANSIACEALQTPTLINSWTAGGGTSVRYYKNPFGEVSFKGAVTGGANNSVAFVLPVGYRPSQTLAFAIPGDAAGSGASVNVQSNGNVTMNADSGYSGTPLHYIDGVHFRV